MTYQPGDHICILYSGARELVTAVRDFFVAGLAKRERCWYVAASGEDRAVRTALRQAGVDVNAKIASGALRFIPASRAYIVRGEFDPETTVRVFNDAIEESLHDGFAGFRAAAEMSWALEPDGGTDRLITYEALLRTLFANCQATGLCLYDRKRMPLSVIDGALSTHPFIGGGGERRANPFYNPDTRQLARVDDAVVQDKLRRLNAVK